MMSFVLPFFLMSLAELKYGLVGSSKGTYIAPGFTPLVVWFQSAPLVVGLGFRFQQTEAEVFNCQEGPKSLQFST